MSDVLPVPVPARDAVVDAQRSIEVIRTALASYAKSLEVMRESMSSVEASLAVASRRWVLISEMAADNAADTDVWRTTQTSPELLEASWRERRQHTIGAARKAANDHLVHYTQRLRDLSDANVKRAVGDMLTELSETYGVAWSDIAAALQISVPALRKWRKNTSGTTPENHRKLAQLTAFYTLLADMVSSPARWMSMPMVEGFNVTPADVYSPDHAERLLDLAAGNAGTTPEGVLDKIAQDWREKWNSEYEVIEAADGEPSMRPRQTTR